MQLITSELARKFYAQANTAKETTSSLDAPIIAKFFHPASDWTWYIIEWDGADSMYGLVDGFEREFGYVSLTELEQTVVFGLHIERDRYFEGRTIRDIMQPNGGRA